MIKSKTLTLGIIFILTLPSMIVGSGTSILNPSLQSYRDGVNGAILGPADIVNVAECDDPAHKYFECDTYFQRSNTFSQVSVVIMDDGLSQDQWNYLESSSNPAKIDIVAYVTDQGPNAVNVYTTPGNHIPSVDVPRHGAPDYLLWGLLHGTLR